MYSFLKAFLVLMKLLSLSQFYAPKHFLFIMIWVLMIGGCSEPRHRFFPGRLRFLAQGASRRFTQWP